MQVRHINIGGLDYVMNERGDILKRRGHGHLKQWPDKDGYLRVAVPVEGKTINRNVHRLVYEAFVGPIDEGFTVDHIDGDKTNNHWSNLQLMSPEDNAIKGNARHWIVTNPAGEVFDVYNLRDFCRKNNLHRGHIYQGKYKGWKCYEK